MSYRLTDFTPTHIHTCTPTVEPSSGELLLNVRVNLCRLLPCFQLALEVVGLLGCFLFYILGGRDMGGARSVVRTLASSECFLLSIPKQPHTRYTEHRAPSPHLSSHSVLVHHPPTGHTHLGRSPPLPNGLTVMRLVPLPEWSSVNLDDTVLD